MRIENVAAVVTGAGSGMGAQTARELAQAGAKVALLDLNLDAASALASEIGGLAVQCNVADAKSVEDAFAAARSAHGPARICVNCAGVATGERIVGREGPMPLAAFSRVIDINLNGTFNALRIASADMADLEPLNETGERGVVIMTASVAAYEGQIGQAAYSASKGGIVALTLPAARELARFGVRVVTIAPGLMDTPMMQGFTQEVRDSLAAQVPFPRRLGEASEYASLVAHIVDNAMLNGEVIRLDGAIRLQPK